MSRKRREQPIIENVTITGVAAEGKSLVRINELVVFVPFVVPGDVVDLKILKKKHSYAEAVAVKFHKLSDVRAVPFCRHFGICGGCKWQNLPYQEQLRFKQQQVVDNLTRIAKVELPEISPILGSEETVRYRNKLEYSFSNMRWLTEEELTELDNPESNAQRKQPGLGFHIPGAFDKVLHINECWLQDEISDRIRNSAYDYAVQHGIPFINLRSQEGILRDMMVRSKKIDIRKRNQYNLLKKYLEQKQFFIETRSPMFKVKKGEEENFKKTFNKLFGKYFFLLSKQEILDYKLFGEFGENDKHELFESSLGDFMAISKDSVKACLIGDNDAAPYSYHGGNSDEEIYVPLIVISN